MVRHNLNIILFFGDIFFRVTARICLQILVFALGLIATQN